MKRTIHTLTECAVGLLLVCSSVSVARAAIPGAPELKDGDVVALIGDGFIEREGQLGYVETALTARYADRNIRFRNLGWSGDTVWGEARAYFGTPEDGFKHLLEHVDLVKPTVIILNYGGNEAFAGEAGLPRFIEGYNRLLDELEKRTKRIFLLSPTPLMPEAYGTVEVPDELVREQNENRILYGRAIRELASRRGCHFVDLYEHFTERARESLLPGETVDGLSLTPYGYQVAEAGVQQGFVGGWPEWMLVEVKDPPLYESLRRAVIEKNELFFHRHRPQNETYLRGFRKHEQGNNAAEIYEFEKLVDEADAKIAAIREKLYEVIRSKENR